MRKLEALLRDNIRSLKPYSSARDEFTGSEGTFLDANENPFGVLNRYPDPYQKKLKERLSVLKGVKQENIFIGNGSDEVIDLAFRIFCEPGKDKVLTFSPTYGMYEVSASINNVEVIKLPLNECFQIHRESLEPYFKEETLKIIFICSPNNPTGNVMKAADITYILDQFDGIVIIDEAYIDFAGEEASSLSLIEQYDRLIVSQTLSKAWGLAGARVGIAYASKPILKLFNKVKPPYNISQLNQVAALQVLSDTALFDRRVHFILYEKERIKKTLRELPLVKKIYPSDANFLLVEVEDANLTYQQLLGQKVIVRNRHNYVKNCIRISIGDHEENNRLLEALKSLS
jgi:histidinol-phosphate aminotransferase